MNKAIKDKGAIALAKGLKSNTSLIELGLRECGITDKGKRALRKAVDKRKAFKLKL